MCMKNKIILVIIVLILFIGAGYLYSQKTQEVSEKPSPFLNKEEDKIIEQKQYIAVKFPNGPTLEYRSDLYFDNLYDKNKTFVFRSNENYASVLVLENYSQSLFSKAGNGKIDDENGSVEYKGTKSFGKNAVIDFESCGLDTCEDVSVIKGPKDQALLIEGDIYLINPDSIVFN